MVQNPLGYCEVFCKGPVAAIVTAGNTHHLPVVTQVYLSTLAVSAASAIHGRIEGHAVAWFEAGNIFPCFCNDAGGLMPHHKRRDAASRRAIISMHIASADATGRDFYQDFVWTRRG